MAAQPVATEPRQSASVEASVVKDEGCEAGNDDRKSDLCAQWKAADAASKTVLIGWWQVGLSFVTMLAAAGAVLYAKHAADAARAANQFTRDAERPWIFVDSVFQIEGAEIAQDGKKIGMATKTTLTNEGSTIAVDVHLVWDVFRTVDLDYEREYQRILDQKDMGNPKLVAPFRTSTVVLDSSEFQFDQRDTQGPCHAALLLYYRSPHSDKQLHTCTFFQMSNISGRDILVKEGYATKMR